MRKFLLALSLLLFTQVSKVSAQYIVIKDDVRFTNNYKPSEDPRMKVRFVDSAGHYFINFKFFARKERYKVAEGDEFKFYIRWQKNDPITVKADIVYHEQSTSSHRDYYFVYCNIDKETIELFKDKTIEYIDGNMVSGKKRFVFTPEGDVLFKNIASAILHGITVNGQIVERRYANTGEEPAVLPKDIARDSIAVEKYLDYTADGNYAYIKSDVVNMDLHGEFYLNRLGYWHITKKQDEADFVIIFTGRRYWPTRWSGRAVFVDPDTNEPFYTTKSANSWASFTFKGKRAVVSKLCNRKIRKDRSKLVRKDYSIDDMK